MYPILFKIGPITIYTYGVMIALAFSIGIWRASLYAKKEKIAPEKILDLCFYILLSAIFGARILYIIINYQDYIHQPLRIFMIWEGGLVFYGGLLLAILVSILYLKSHHLQVWKVGDILAPYIALGYAIGRWGCFFAGCCYGKPTDLPWAITFTDPQSLAHLNTPLHPTQLYDSFLNLITFFILVIIRKRKRFEGQVFLTYLILYSTTRFIVEIFRGDDRGYLIEGMLSTSQSIAIPMFVISIIIMLIRLKNKKSLT